MDSEIKDKISELNDLEVKYSVLIDKYKEMNIIISTNKIK